MKQIKINVVFLDCYYSDIYSMQCYNGLNDFSKETQFSRDLNSFSDPYEIQSIAKIIQLKNL